MPSRNFWWLNQILICCLIVHIFSPVLADHRKVEQEVERINKLRETLVRGVKAPVTPELFKAVCGPVGKEAARVAKKNGWIFRQASHKYRNPKNKASKVELAATETFLYNSDKKSDWLQVPDGEFYFRRIRIETSCLTCHGLKEKRPDFIKKKYPLDKAYNFIEGDFRGLYSVFVPKSKK